MALTNRDIAKAIIEVVGGASNIQEVHTCMTRLHLRLNDRSKVDESALKDVEGVLGTVPGDVYQIVFGPGKVTKIGDEAKDLLKDTLDQNEIDLAKRGKEEKAKRVAKQTNPVQVFFKRFANIFLPLLPGIAGAGLINGLTKAFNFYTESAYVGEWWYALIMTIGWALFLYLPIFVGMNAAKEFGGTPVLGGIGGALSVSHSAMPLLKKIGEGELDIILPITNAPFNPATGGILAAVFTGAMIAFIEKRVRRIVPDVLDMFLTPLITLLLSAFISLLVLQPLGGLLASGILGFADILLTKFGIIGGFILAVLQLPLVSVGLHRAFLPIHAMMNDPQGVTQGVNFLLPILMAAGGGQVGAVLALYFKTKNVKLKSAILASAPAGVLGVGEPLMYGVTLPLGKPFLTACIGSGFGGMMMALLNVGAVSQGVSGLLGFLIMQPGSHLSYLIGMLTAYIAGFIITYFFGYEEKAIEDVFGE